MLYTVHGRKAVYNVIFGKAEDKRYELYNTETHWRS